MDNLPESLYVDPSGAGPSSSSPSSSSTTRGGASPLPPPNLHSASVDQLIVLLREPQHREDALFLLNKEVTETYKLLIPSKLTTKHSNRVCNALALFQCVASHPETRMSFIKAKIPIYLYPFLNTTENGKPFEFLRLTSLGVIGALVKVPGPSVEYPQVIHFLLETEVFPLCLRCMELGNELSKTVAIFIVSKILLQEEGLQYCCAFAERFFSVVRVLGGMLEKLAEEPSIRLIKHIICCYLRLSEMPRACDALKRNFPAKLRDDNFINIINEDPITMRCLQQLVYNVTNGQWSRSEQAGDAYGHFPGS